MRKGTQMINGIGPTGLPSTTRTDGVQRGGPAARVAPVNGDATEATHLSPAAELASSGPPVDVDKIAAIRAAIAEGRYPIDPDAIAASMIALDLPVKR